MALRFTTTSQAGTEHGVKTLVYAPAGHGKTSLCATAPSPFIFSAESGLLALRKHNIPAAEISTIEDLNEAYRWTTESAEARQFATVCLDSLTEIAEVLLATAKKTAKDPRQAYGEMMDRMTVVVKAFRDLPGKHVYMSAKTELVKDEITGVVRSGPSMPGTKLGPALPYLFDEVFYLGINKDQQGQKYRYLLTDADLQFTAKDRSGALDLTEYPDLTNIINKIQGVTSNGST